VTMSHVAKLDQSKSVEARKKGEERETLVF
jgi:hypothetical protein